MGFPLRRTDFHGGLDWPFGLRIPGVARLLTRATLRMDDRVRASLVSCAAQHCHKIIL
jgi:hypothetical protein